MNDLKIISNDPFLATCNKELKDHLAWEEMIREHASYDQKKTSIRLERAYCRVYQPSHMGKDDFIPLQEYLLKIVEEMIDRLGLRDGREFYLEEGTWGLIYADGESCGPHGHGRTNEYAGVYYLNAEPGCGTIFFPDMKKEIEPKTGDLILFGSRVQHGVMPNTIKGSERVCVAFNVKKKNEPV